MRTKFPSVPKYGRAIILPTKYGSLSVILRTYLQILYNSSNGIISSCAAICKTGSADV